MRHVPTLTLVLLLVGCGGATATTTATEPAPATSSTEPPPPTGGPIAFTPTPDIAAAGAGPIQGQLWGQDATLTVRFNQVDGSWALAFDSAEGTGLATGLIGLEGAVAPGAMLRSTAASRPGFLCDPTGANQNNSEVSYAIEITSATLSACPGGPEWSDIGTASGRIVLLVRDPAAAAPDSYLTGTFTDAAVSCMSMQ